MLAGTGVLSTVRWGRGSSRDGFDTGPLEAGLLLAETGESSQGRALLAKLLYCVLWRFGSEGKVDAHRWVAAPLSRVIVRWGAAGVGGLVVLVAAAVVKLLLEPASETDDLLMKLASVRRAVAHGFSPRAFLFG